MVKGSELIDETIRNQNAHTHVSTDKQLKLINLFLDMN